MTIVIDTLENIALDVINNTLDAALSAVSTSMSVIFAFFGESFERDIIYQIDQLVVDLDINLNNILLSVEELKLNVDISLANIDIEFDNMFRGLSVPSLKAINPPSLELLTTIGKPEPFGPIPPIAGISGLGIIILSFFGILSILVVYDAMNISEKRIIYESKP